jgi:hypothetical protein
LSGQLCPAAPQILVNAFKQILIGRVHHRHRQLAALEELDPLMHRVFESPAEQSEAIARQWGIDYAALHDDTPDDMPPPWQHAEIPAPGFYHIR